MSIGKITDYQICSKTVMDNISDPDITFDKEGICNYYHEYQKQASLHLLPEPQRTQKLNEIIDRIKQHGKNKKYDCLIGLSGGVDSTYVAWLTKQYSLRPLAVHLDNGWNSELAVKNIENIINILNIDLHTLVVNWDEFKDIQLSYLKASVVDIEVVTDHAIYATMVKLAKEYKISDVIIGSNMVTEFIMPPSWYYNKQDYANLKNIHKIHGSIPIRSYPTFPFWKYVYFGGILKLIPFSILNYVDYNKADIKSFITDKLNWRDYGGKHYESIFTKFYQAYILPEKFSIDKRKAHLSSLICSGQITREEALQELKKPLYQTDELKNDKEYVLKKFGLTNKEFEDIMGRKPRPHSDYKTDLHLKRFYMKTLEQTAPIRKLFK